jgi:hypothetical protein
MRRINAWTIAKADKVMLVYGETDPWSTGRFTPRVAKHADNYTFEVPLGNHSSNIFKLTGEDRKLADDVLAQWLDLPAGEPVGKYVLRPVEQLKTSAPVVTNRAINSDEEADMLEHMKQLIEHPELRDRG